VHIEYRLRVDVNLCCSIELEVNANIFGCGDVTHPLSTFTKPTAVGTLIESGRVKLSLTHKDAAKTQPLFSYGVLHNCQSACVESSLTQQ